MKPRFAVLAVTAALAGSAVARADATVPTAPDDWRAAEVAALPSAGTFRVVVHVSAYQGCSYSYHSRFADAEAVLTLGPAATTRDTGSAAGAAKLDLHGTTREVRGGRSSDHTPPRAYSDERGTIDEHLRGTVRRDGDALVLALDAELESMRSASTRVQLACHVGDVQRDGVPRDPPPPPTANGNANAGATKSEPTTARALVCELQTGTLLPGHARTLPFGRARGFTTSAHYDRDSPITVALAR
jgi:hypothetical protein